MGSRRPINLTVVGIYTAVTAGLLWVPLLNVLNAEAGAVIAALAFFVGGLDAVSLFSRSERVRPRVRTVALMHLGYLLIPFIIYQFARIWLPGCGFWAGVKFYLLFPVVSAVLGIAIAFFLTGLRLRRVRLWFAVVGVVLVVVPVVYDLATHPQFYVYNHVFGGVLGPIYDLELAVRPGLYWFRLMTLLWAGLAVLVGYALREPVRGGFLGISLIAVALVFLYANPGRFGYNTTYGLLAAELGSEMRTAHFVIHYDSTSVSRAEIESLSSDHEFRYFQLAERLGFDAEFPIHSYIYPDAATRAELTGAGFTNIAPVWLARPQLHVLLDSYHRSFTHELAHVFSREFGLPGINASLHVGLVEGFAVAMEPPDGFPSPDEQVASVVNSPSRSGIYGQGSVAQAVASALSPMGFWTGRSTVSYTTLGSFVGYLIDNFGIDRFTRVYRLEDFRSVYERPAGVLASAWEQTLIGRPVDPDVHNLAAARFSLLSLFELHCPHDVAPSYRLFRAGENRLAAGDTLGALSRLERSMEYDPPVIRAVDLWAGLNLARGEYDETARKLGSVWKDDEAYPAILGIRLGDAHALSGFEPRAVAAYAGSYESTTRFSREARAILTLRMQVADRPEIIEQLIRGDAPELRAERLAALRDSTGVAAILAGRLWAEADDYRAAVDALKAAAASHAARSIGERYWAWLAAFAYRARHFESSERFRGFAVKAAMEAGDVYQIERLEDFGDRISWARNIGFD